MTSPNGKPEAPATAQDDLERLRRILNRDEYTVYHDRAAADRFSLSEWIAKQLKKLFPSFDIPPGAGKAVEYGLAVLLLAVAVFAIVWISRQLVRSARLRGWAELQEQAAGQSPAAFLQQARELAASARWREAVRSGFLALLGGLEQKGSIRIERWKTNWDYAEELKRTDAAHLIEPFRSGAAEFERIWYGKEPVAAERFEAFYALVAGLLQDGEGERHAPVE